MRLSPTTCYYIRKLLHQLPGKTRDVTMAKSSTLAGTLFDLNEILRTLYPSITEISTVIQQLENLVCLHSSLRTQVSLYVDYGCELIKLEQQIFRLLGFQKAGV